jgi:hypothetical protein
VAKESDMHLPLHAPEVNTANIEKLRSTGIIAEALSWIEGLASKTSLKKRQKTEARQEDIDTLERAGIIERCTKEQIVTTGSLFSVVEEEKKRRRPIYWPKAPGVSKHEGNQSCCDSKHFHFMYELLVKNLKKNLPSFSP